MDRTQQSTILLRLALSLSISLALHPERNTNSNVFKWNHEDALSFPSIHSLFSRRICVIHENLAFRLRSAPAPARVLLKSKQCELHFGIVSFESLLLLYSFCSLLSTRCRQLDVVVVVNKLFNFSPFGWLRVCLPATT